ncbi:MAG TPA: hypothetical protein VGD99_22690 [Anaerolineae bacterium]|jgi:hypothetical protein
MQNPITTIQTIGKSRHQEYEAEARQLSDIKRAGGDDRARLKYKVALGLSSIALAILLAIQLL